MKKYILFFASICFLSISVVQAQTVFQSIYGGENTDDLGESVIETADGNFVFVGTTASFGVGGFDMYLIKTDAEGNELWTEAYGTSRNEAGIGVQELEGGSLIVVGTTILLGGNSQIFASKADAEGNEIWSKGVGDFGATATDVTLSADGNIVIAAERNDDPYLLQIEAEGNLQWDNVLGFGAIQGLQSVALADDGGYIMVASTSILIGDEMTIIKTDSEGDFEWLSSAVENDSGSRLEARSVIQTQDGGFIGLSNIGGGVNAAFAYKVNSQGDSVWIQQHSLQGDDIEVFDIAEGSDGSLYIVGEGELEGEDFDAEVFVLKLDSEGNLLWEEVYNYDRFESGNSIVETSTGNLIISGTTDSFNGTGNDFLGLQINANGGVIWQESYGTTGNADFDQGFAVLQLEDGGYLLGASSNSFNERGDFDQYLLRLDKDGKVLWTKTLDFFNGTDAPYNMVQAANGDIGLYGVAQDEAGNFGFQLTRMDVEGNVIWHKHFDNLMNVFTKGIVALEDNGFVICGRLSIGGVFYAKVDADGEVLWENSYVGNVAYNIKPTSDGGYILAGRGNFQQDAETGAFFTPLQVVKTDENGTIVWEHFMGDGGHLLSRAFDIVETIGGSFVFWGAQTGATADTANPIMIKLSNNGNVLWEKEVELGDYSFNNYVIEQTRDNGFMLMGNVGAGGDIAQQGFLLKTDGFGTEKWIRYFGAEVGVFPTIYDGLQTEDGGYAMTGRITVNNSTEVYFVKTDELGFTDFVGIFSPDSRLLLQLAPNPSQGRFQFTLESGYIGALEVKIFDTAGRQIYENTAYKNQNLYQEQLDVSNLQSGIYVVEVMSGDKRYTQRLVIGH